MVLTILVKPIIFMSTRSQKYGRRTKNDAEY